MKLIFLNITILLFFIKVNSQSTFKDTTFCNMDKCFCGNDLTPAGVMISHVHNKNEWMFAYRNMTMNMLGNQIGSNALNTKEILNQYNSSPNNMQMKMQMFMLMYGISDRLTVMSMFHYQSNYMEMQMKMGDVIHSHSMKTKGFGDTKIMALYAIIKKESTQLILSTGLNIPSGAYNLKGSALDMMYPASRLPYNMQLGSGSLDFLPSLTYIIKSEKYTLSSQFNSTLRLKNNPIGYRFGNDYSINTWFAYSLLPFLSSSFRLEGIVVEKLKGRDKSLAIDKEPNSNFTNYGGNYMNAFIGTVFQLKKTAFNKFRVSFEYGLPLYQNTNGIQMTNKNSFIITTSINF